MIKIAPRHILLYLTGSVLILFGNREYWEKLKNEERRNVRKKRIEELSSIESSKAFEIQKITFDSVKKEWINKHISFQTIVIPSDFKATNKVEKITSIETDREENASDSF
jgi:hypothetical protein